MATPGWNDMSIGIGLLNDNTGRQFHPPAQLDALTEPTRTLGERYAIPVEGVVRKRSLHETQPLASEPR